MADRVSGLLFCVDPGVSGGQLTWLEGTAAACMNVNMESAKGCRSSVPIPAGVGNLESSALGLYYVRVCGGTTKLLGLPYGGALGAT